MLMKPDSAASFWTQKRLIYPIVLVAAALVVVGFAFSEALLELTRRWIVQDEYSHGF